MMMTQKDQLIFEKSRSGRRAFDLPANDVEVVDVKSILPAHLVRQKPAELPEVSELQLMRHYTALSNKNFGLETGFYPLGSCTMKYNPKVNEDIARYSGFANTHPYQNPETTQGALELMYELQNYLKAISGMDEVSLQPAAGAQGEWTALLLFKKHHEKNGQGETRKKILIPDSAHGTNPATAAICGFDIIEIKSNQDGTVSVDALKEVVGPDTAGMMMTNPNTLGLFENNIKEIADIIHEAGGLMYCDGANSNAILGLTKPSEMGFDAVHFNLHKTFSTPHGGGGPGSGPVAVKDFLKPYLPIPQVEKLDDKYVLNSDYPDSIGRVKGYFGNFGVNVRAYAYIRAMGPDGLRQVSEDAILNANYLKARLEPYYDTPYPQICKHEFVLSGNRQKKQGANTKDIAKRLLDYGFYAPTVYFPLIVSEALMIEPTETEAKETLDEFADAMIEIAKAAEVESEMLNHAPYQTSVKRLDETLAARKPIVKY